MNKTKRNNVTSGILDYGNDDNTTFYDTKKVKHRFVNAGRNDVKHSKFEDRGDIRTSHGSSDRIRYPPPRPQSKSCKSVNSTSSRKECKPNPFFYEPISSINQVSNLSSIFQTKGNITYQSDEDDDKFDRYTSFDEMDESANRENSITPKQKERNNYNFDRSNESYTTPTPTKSRGRPIVITKSDTSSEIKYINQTLNIHTNKAYPLLSQNKTLAAAATNNAKLTFCVNCSSFIIVPKHVLNILCPNCNHIFQGIFHHDTQSIHENHLKEEIRGLNTHEEQEAPNNNDHISDCTLTHALKPERNKKIRLFKKLKLPFSKKKSTTKQYIESIKETTVSSAVCLGTDCGIFKVAEGFSSCTESDIQNFIQILQNGVKVHIFNKNSLKEKTLYLFHENIKYIMIGSPRNCFDLSTCMEVRYGLSVDGLHPDLRGTPTLRGQCDSKDLSRSFSIIFPNGTVDVLAEDKAYCKFLARGFSALCVYIQLEKLKKEYKMKCNEIIDR